MMDVLYPNQRLDPDKNELRLLALSKNHSSTFQCSLVKKSSDESIAYHAQSYVWGGQKPSEPIYINGHRVYVTKNLMLILETLQRATNDFPADTVSYHWVDAICLNQADKQEIEAQVPRMDVIFSGAMAVVATVGAPTDDIELVLNTIDRVGQKLCLLSMAVMSGAFELHECIDNEEKLGMVEGILQRSVEDSDKMKCAILQGLRSLCRDRSSAMMLAKEVAWMRTDDLHDKMYCALRAFLKRDFWHRVWIYQELFLDKNVFIVSGTTVTKLERLLAVWQVMFETIWVWDDVYPSENLLHGANATLLITDSAMIGSLINVKLHPRDLFGFFNGVIGFLGCEKQQDHIYGLLAAASNGKDLGLTVDYYKPLHDIIMELSVGDTRWLEHENLSHAGAFVGKYVLPIIVEAAGDSLEIFLD